MRRYYGDCPNCGGGLVLENDGKYYCESCGTAYAPDLNRKEVDEELKASEPKLRKQEEELKSRLETEKVELRGQSTSRKQQEAANWERGSRISKMILVGFFAFIVIAFAGIMFVTNILPMITSMNAMSAAEQADEGPALAFSIGAIDNFDTLRKDSDKLVMTSKDGYTIKSADLLNAYLITPISTTPDHNCLLLVYEAKGNFGSDNMDGSVIRVICINNVTKTDTKLTDDMLIGNSEVMSDTFVEKCFRDEKSANDELLRTLGRDYHIEALDPAREVAS